MYQHVGELPEVTTRAYRWIIFLMILVLRSVNGGAEICVAVYEQRRTKHEQRVDLVLPG